MNDKDAVTIQDLETMTLDAKMDWNRLVQTPYGTGWTMVADMKGKRISLLHAALPDESKVYYHIGVGWETEADYSARRARSQ